MSWDCIKKHPLRGRLLRTVAVDEDGAVSTADTRTKRETNRWVAEDVLSCVVGDDDTSLKLTVRKGKGRDVLRFIPTLPDETAPMVAALKAVAAMSGEDAPSPEDTDVGGAFEVVDDLLKGQIRSAAETACLTLGQANSHTPSPGGRRMSRFLSVKGMLVEEFGVDVVEQQKSVWGSVLVNERKSLFSLRAESASAGGLDLSSLADAIRISDAAAAAEAEAEDEGEDEAGAAAPPAAPNAEAEAEAAVDAIATAAASEAAAAGEEGET
mgnify:CR=1 FL=1